ncbi:MAG: Tll0287-like domain-containing protein [Nitrospiraceae bacterium]
MVVAAFCATIWLVPGIAVSRDAAVADEVETARQLVALLKLSYSLVSEHQAEINDPTKGDKGFTPAFVSETLTTRFRNQEHIDFSQPDGTSQGALLRSLLECQKAVVASYQAVINRPGIGFKGFLPTLFARKAGDQFFEKTGIKLKHMGTDYRYPGNKPDDFETQVLQMFADSRHPKGQPYGRNMMVAGKPSLRLMQPEYATASCLSCHGSPKGERDITGIRKEGWKEGELAGAISVTMPLR